MPGTRTSQRTLNMFMDETTMYTFNTSKRGFKLLTYEVVFVVVRKENQIDAWQIVKVDGGVSDTLCGHTRAEMDVVACVEEVGLEILSIRDHSSF
jgi:hypothetical protein